MKKRIILKVKKTCFTLCCITLIFTLSCKKAADELKLEKQENVKLPPAAVNGNREAGPVDVSHAFKAKDAKLIGNNENQRIAASTYVSFSDRTACTWNPNICNNSFTVWPGYIQKVGSKWSYSWMSYGPGTNFIPYGTGDHYHIVGLFDPKTEPNPQASAMFGTDWFAFYMQTSSGRVNFNLTQIRVVGVPITLWFKAADGSWRYWGSLGTGTWNLPGATNIQEFHVRSASGVSTDHWAIDDILVE